MGCCGRRPDGPAAEGLLGRRRAKGSWRGRPRLSGGASFWPHPLLKVAGGGLAFFWCLARKQGAGISCLVVSSLEIVRVGMAVFGRVVWFRFSLAFQGVRGFCSRVPSGTFEPLFGHTSYDVGGSFAPSANLSTGP